MEPVTYVHSITKKVIGHGAMGVLRDKLVHPFGKKWFVMSQDALEIMEKCRSAQDHRVFCALARRMSYQNKVTITQKALAKALGISDSHLSESIKRLSEMGVIRPPETDNSTGHKFFVVSESVAWRLTSKRH